MHKTYSQRFYKCEGQRDDHYESNRRQPSFPEISLGQIDINQICDAATEPEYGELFECKRTYDLVFYLHILRYLELHYCSSNLLILAEKCFFRKGCLLKSVAF